MEFCKKCNNTGATGDSDYLDCGEPGCSAATDRAEFDKWLLREGYPQSGIKEWSIYRHAIRTAVEALPMALEEIEQLKLAKENLIQQAQQQAMEARTQRGTVLDILRHFGCPEEDWNALTLVKAAHEKEVQRALEGQLTEMGPGGALYQPQAWPDAWHALRSDVLSGVDGLDNDQVNTVLGMLDNYEPEASTQIPVQAGMPSPDPIVETNVALLRSRSAVGVAKYGTTLADNKLPLRAWLNHALEETLDNANYLQAAMQTIDAAPQQHAQAAQDGDKQVPQFAEVDQPLSTEDRQRLYSESVAKLKAAEANFRVTGNAQAALSDIEDPIIVPRGLVGAACSAINKKRDAPKVLAELRRYTTGDLSSQQPDAAPAKHADDIAVDRFAMAMKHKLAVSRDKGRGGWDDESQCTMGTLAKMLVEHVAKGDPVDIANFAMMLHQREAAAFEHNPCYGGDAVRVIRHAVAPAAAPAIQQEGAALDERACLMDVVSHHSDFIAACHYRREACIKEGDTGNAAYWAHQIATLNRMADQASAALASKD